MKSQYRMLFAFSALLIVSLACRFGASPTSTEAPVNEEPPVVAPSEPVQTEEPTLAATEPPVEQTTAQDFFTEEFDGDISNWTYFTSKNDVNADDSGVEPVAENGFLILDLAKFLNVYVMYDPYTYTNVRLDVRVEIAAQTTITLILSAATLKKVGMRWRSQIMVCLIFMLLMPRKEAIPDWLTVGPTRSKRARK
jgi:hypothetical protein